VRLHVSPVVTSSFCACLYHLQGDIRLKPGPLGGIRAIDMHPTRPMLVGITQRGSVLALAPPPLFTYFPGTMYPPGFLLALGNKEHEEAENEYERELQHDK